MEKPTKGLVAWGEWGSSLVDESGSPPPKRWVVHTVSDTIKPSKPQALKDFIKNTDNQLKRFMFVKYISIDLRRNCVLIQK
jgi:hypothetical protein